MKETLVPLSQLLRKIKKEKWPSLPTQSIEKAAREKKFETARSGFGHRARYYVLPSVLKKYLQGLGVAITLCLLIGICGAEERKYYKIHQGKTGWQWVTTCKGKRLYVNVKPTQFNNATKKNGSTGGGSGCLGNVTILPFRCKIDPEAQRRAHEYQFGRQIRRYNDLQARYRRQDARCYEARKQLLEDCKAAAKRTRDLIWFDGTTNNPSLKYIPRPNYTPPEPTGNKTNRIEVITIATF